VKTENVLYKLFFILHNNISDMLISFFFCKISSTYSI